MIKNKKAKPSFWVPSLYFSMGVPISIVTVVSAIMYKNLGVSNSEIALHTGLMYLPWAIKPFWAPLVDVYKTKRFFVLFTQFAAAVMLGCVAISLPLNSFMPLTLAFFWVIGFLSSTHDIAADGVYISNLNKVDQAKWIGAQGIFWSGAKVLSAGVLVSFTGYLHDAKAFTWVESWMFVMIVLGVLMLVLAVWHIKFLPNKEAETARTDTNINLLASYADVFKNLMQKKNIVIMLLFSFFYRFGEGFIEKIGPLFMLDSLEIGGLGINNVDLGYINGTYGTVSFIVGAFLGGLFASKIGLKRSLFIMCLALNVPNVTYVYLSYFQPESIEFISWIVVLEKFGYGIGSVGNMLYMMQQISPGKYKTAHYALASGLYGLCMMLTGAVSGVIQESVGYQSYFMIAMLASIPSFVFTWLAPFNDISENEDFLLDES